MNKQDQVARAIVMCAFREFSVGDIAEHLDAHGLLAAAQHQEKE